MTTLQRSIRSSKEVLRRWAFAWLAALAFMATGVAVFAAEPSIMLDYRMNGSHQGSALTVFSDGRVEHTEWTCCPRLEWDYPETSLNNGDLARIRELGERAANGGERTRELVSRVGHLTGGALKVWPDKKAAEVTVYSLTAKEYEGWFYRETERLSEATDDLFRWIKIYARVLPDRT